jgi:hypothetical protein
MTATKLLLTVPQAEDLVRLLPPHIKAAKRSGERVICITVKTMTGTATEPTPADVKKFSEGAPFDHVNRRFLDAH